MNIPIIVFFLACTGTCISKLPYLYFRLLCSVCQMAVMHPFPKVSSFKRYNESTTKLNRRNIGRIDHRTLMTDTRIIFSVIGQLDKALPANILDKYNDRVQEESINLAALDDLVRYISAELNLNLSTVNLLNTRN